MSLQSPSSLTATTTFSSSSNFTINSYIQNLAAVLSDTHRTRSEVSAFFTRHWGEQFVPRQNIPPAQTIPIITLEHFRQYLATTAKKHKQYLKARRALRQKQQQNEEERISRDVIPEIFFSPTFSRHTQHTFEAVFLEPKPGETDNLLSLNEKRREALYHHNPFIERHESFGSLNSFQGSQQQLLPPIEASNGRYFRSCSRLQYKLEYFDVAISTLLSQQLETRNESFWKSVHSYEALHDDLNESIERIKIARQKLLKIKNELCQRSQKLIQLYYAKINRQKLFDRLQEIACLRDAQTTVQMLLNQDDVPRALECIQTAMEVLSSDLIGVNCFRHLGSQLDETKKMIGKMLLEEFEDFIQREFAWPIEEKRKKQQKIFDEEEEMSHLHPIVFSLIRCHEFRFLTILREKITDTIKNSTKQVIKSQILIHLDEETIGYNPAKLSEHISKLTDEQWNITLEAVTCCLAILCNKIKSIQELIIKCYDQINFEEIEQQPLKQNNKQKNSRSGSISNKSTDKTSDKQSSSSPSPSQQLSPLNPVISVSIPCHNINQLPSASIQLIKHAIYLCEENISKRIQSRFKDHVLEKSSPLSFNKTCKTIEEFRQFCKKIDENTSGQEGQQRSPIQSIIQQINNKFLTKFTETRQHELSSTIDTEPWKACSNINLNIRLIIKRFEHDGVLTCIVNNDEIIKEENDADNNIDEIKGDVLQLNNENYIVIDSALLLINILAEYSDFLRLFPSTGIELIMDVIQCLKLFNSRTCQLILGAGARQLVGLKTINVKHLALASRSLQLILNFIPILKNQFSENLTIERQSLLRHFDSTERDYNDHINEIKSKLIVMIDRELLTALEEWKPEGKSPTPQFKQIVMQIGKFYSSYSAIMPPKLTTEMLHSIHDNLKLYFKQNVHSRGVTPHNSIAYGMAGQDFAYYVENIRALPDCLSFPDDSINEVLQQIKK